MARRANVEWETPKNDQSEYVVIELLMDIRAELRALNAQKTEKEQEKGSASSEMSLGATARVMEYPVPISGESATVKDPNEEVPIEQMLEPLTKRTSNPPKRKDTKKKPELRRR